MNKKVEAFLRRDIAESVGRLSENQLSMFKRLFGDDVGKIPADKLEGAMALVDRTLLRKRKE